MKTNEGIAIVGMDCRYPGANNIEQYWENILSLRQQFRHIPDKRLNMNDYFSKDKSKVDKTYSKTASIITGYNFDRIKYKVSKSTFERTDFTHWLALDVAAGALKDAGFENGEGLDKNRVGVVLGNSLTGEFSRSGIMRLRWPYVRKVLAKTLNGMNYTQEEINTILNNAEKTYKEPFPEPDADSLAGGLSNTISGRICNYFDFHGGGFTVDGACASSLLAFENGCNAILNNSLDVVLVGGVDLSIDPFEIIGFARNGALAMNEMEVFSAKSEGFWPGEGCGIVVLMKESEAIARNLNIYSVIRGCGISSDGSGGITRPKSETQQLAFSRAYQKAGYEIDKVAMFEGHGTGTPTGDQVEMAAIINSLKEADKKDAPAILGSVKHLIGHTKAAAGVAGVIKASLAIKHGIIPASRKNTPHSLLTENDNIIKLASKPVLWDNNTPMRASVSSMGFGGINVHLTMEEAANNKRQKKLSGKIIKLSESQRDGEVFPFSANSKNSFLEIITRFKSLARDISRAEFIDLSATITASFEDKGAWKGSIVAKTPNELYENLGVLEAEILQNKTRFIDTNKGIFFDCDGKSKPVGFLFPGQGAPIYSDFGVFSAWVNQSKTEVNIQKSGVVDTSIAQPEILKNSLISVEVLEKFGVEANFGIGHSLGEISALAWAGVIGNDDAKSLAVARGKAMSELGEKDGTMLAVKCDEKTLDEITSNFNVFITGYNGTGNYVVGGHIDDIKKVENHALNQGIHHVKLKVSHAFHTPMMKKAALQFKSDLAGVKFNAPNQKVISTVTTKSVGAETDFQQMLYEQIEAPVYFTQAIDSIKDNNPILIEVGPGNALSRSLQEYQDFEVVSLDFGSSSIRGLLNTLSLAYVSGNSVYFDELSINRFYKTFDVENWQLDAFVNPCEETDFESSFIEENETSGAAQSCFLNQKEGNSTSDANLESSVIGIQNHLKTVISKKIEIPFEMLNAGDKLMSQLHINSLAITEILSIVVKAFNKSQMVFSEASILANADASIEELSNVIFKGESSDAKKNLKESISFENVHNWSHIFQRQLTPKKASKLNIEKYNGNVFIAGDEEKVKLLTPTLTNSSANFGDVSIFVYSTALASEELFDFVKFLRKPEVKNNRKVVLLGIIDDKITGDLKPILKTFQLENPNFSTLSIEIQNNDTDFEKIVGEIRNTTKYKEIHFGVDGVRSESELAFYYPAKADLKDALSSEDVILATGGGKGITFESVFALAKNTGAKLVIMGRSLPEKDEELRSNLKRLYENNIDYKYLSADVCSSESVLEGISSIKEFGNITALIHGAGVNYPKALHLLSPEDFDRTHFVKVEGLKNVLNALNLESLKLLIGYGSIIAQSGMHGNADYAWANDQLARLIENVGKENSHCRCLTLEWSVWDETGMGVSLNTINTLKEKGVFAIPVSHGVEILKAIVADKSYSGGRLVISGRFGNMPTLNYVKERLPLGRFVSNIKHHIPKVEIVSEVSVNLKEDIYLQNHVFQGQYVFPTVMILEGMSQVCSVLEAETPTWVFEDLKINKSIFVPQSEANIVRFIVTRVSKNTFHAVVQSEDSDFQVNCFEAYIKLGKNEDNSLKRLPLPYSNKLSLDTETNFYDDLLFHHGPFRRIKAFSELSALKSIANATESLTDIWFNEYLPQNQILGDAGLNDAAIHCHQACRPHQSLLPTAVGKIVFNPNPIQGPFFISTQEVHHIGNVTRINSYVINAKGEIKQYWENLDLTSVTGSGFSGEWNMILLANYIEYILIQMSLGSSIHRPKNLVSHLSVITSKDFNKVSIAIDGFFVTLRKKLGKTDDSEASKKNNLFVQDLNIEQVKETVTLEIESLPKNTKISTLNSVENAYS